MIVWLVEQMEAMGKINYLEEFKKEKAMTAFFLKKEWFF